MRNFPLPDLDYFLVEGEVPKYAYKKSFDQARMEPLVVLHTSGSTGTPQAVVMRHGTLSSIDAYHLIPSLGGRKVIGPSFKGKRMFLGFPLFHAASLCYLLCLNIYCGLTCVLPPPKVPMTPDLIDRIHACKSANLQGSILPPSILVDLTNDPAFFANLEKLQSIIYAGGPLPKEVGDKISLKTRLITLTGSTEVGLPAIEDPDDGADWEYVRYSPFMGYDFRPLEVKGQSLYEQFVVRNDKYDLFQSVFSTFPEIDEFPMKDLYEEHINKPSLVRLRGRTDDIIVLSNAEKLNPVTMEAVITAHPAILSALVAGHGKFQTSLLVEPRKFPIDSKELLLDDIWPMVQKANQLCPTHGRIMKDCIIFTKAEKPVPRAAKGTVQRMMTLDLYKDEIDELYDPRAAAGKSSKDSASGQETLQEFLSRIISDEILLESLSDDADFFEAGLDSLQVIALTKRINSFNSVSRPELRHISPATIYKNSNIAKLEIELENPRLTVSEDKAQNDRQQRMQGLYKAYSADLSTTKREILSPYKPPNSAVVLLTGSTGSLGSHLLDVLLSTASVSKVYCLNRGNDSEERQKKAHQTTGLPTDFKKARFIYCDLSQSHLGLNPSTYDQLLREVTHILHNAWDVNFNRSIDSFAETHIHGVKQIIDFSNETGATLLFVSTISAVNRCRQTSGGKNKAQEEIITDWTASQEMGYSESKLVAENLITAARQASNIPTIICRVGQLAGATMETAIWNRNEWVAALVISSVYLGQLPDSIGPLDTIDWVPVNLASRTLLEILFARPHSPGNGHGNTLSDAISAYKTSVYHILNPNPTTYRSLIPPLLATLPSPPTVVPFKTWLSTLKQSANDTDIMHNPALKLLTFFETLNANLADQPQELDIANAARDSATLADLEPITAASMRIWMRGWGIEMDVSR